MTAVTCAACRRTADERPLTWTMSVEATAQAPGESGRTVYYCEQCSRQNLRAIEGRLDQAWW